MKKMIAVALLGGTMSASESDAALIAYEGFTQGTANPAVAGYSGTSEVGLTGTWTQLGGQAMTIRDGSGGQWGAPQTYWPAAEHNAWWTTQATRSMSATIDLTGTSTYYLSYYIGTDQNDHVSQLGFSNGTNEIIAGNGYGGSRDITAYYGAIGTDVATNGDGTAIEGGWNGQMRQYFVIGTITSTGGDVDVTLDYYRDAYDGVAETSRTISLGTVNDTFNTLTFKADGGMNLDELRVADDFTSVLPEPSTALLGGLGLLCLLRRRR